MCFRFAPTQTQGIVQQTLIHRTEMTAANHAEFARRFSVSVAEGYISVQMNNEMNAANSVNADSSILHTLNLHFNNFL